MFTITVFCYCSTNSKEITWEQICINFNKYISRCLQLYKTVETADLLSSAEKEIMWALFTIRDGQLIKCGHKMNLEVR